MADEETVIDDKTLDAELTESIGATLRDIQSREAPEETAAAPAEDATTAPAPAKAAGDKPRAVDGKFVAAKDAPQTSAAPATKPANQPTQAEASSAATAEGSEALKFGDVPVDLNRAPSSWKPAAKALWAGLPAPIREEIYRRETNFANTHLSGPLKENADFGQTIRKTVEPYKAIIEAEGGTYERAIADTMKTAALFRTGQPQEKLEALFQIDQRFCRGALKAHFQQRLNEEVAKATGQPAPAAPAQPQQQFMDPRVDTIMASLQAQERERASHLERQSNNAVETFIAAKGADGQPLYPFVDNVLDDMSERVAILRRQNPALEHTEALKQAYEAAVWANPETRAVLLSQKQTQATQTVESQRRVTQAKQALAGNMPRRGSIPAATGAAHLRLGTPESDDSIRQTYRELTG